MASRPKQQNPRMIALLVTVFCGTLVWPVAFAEAGVGPGFVVKKVTSHLVDEVYHLDAQVEYGFNAAVLEALESGVPVTVEMDIEVLHPRDWLWDETVYSLHQRYRIKYHALTRKYLVANLNNNVQSSYPTLRVALNAIGTVKGLPILDRRLLKVGEHYNARLRTRLVLAALPSPLRMWAYLSSDWRQASAWYEWRLQ